MFTPKLYGSNSKTLRIQLQDLKDLLPPPPHSRSYRPVIKRIRKSRECKDAKNGRQINKKYMLIIVFQK